MPRILTLAVAALLLLLGCANHETKETTMPSTSPAGGEDASARPAAAVGIEPGWELAPRAQYEARQASGEVTITARGENPTAGFETKLVQSPQEIWPPQFLLARKRPDGMVAQVITPFEVSASFKAGERVQQVVIRDAEGNQKVPVESK